MKKHIWRNDSEEDAEDLDVRSPVQGCAKTFDWAQGVAQSRGRHRCPNPQVPRNLACQAQTFLATALGAVELDWHTGGKMIDLFRGSCVVPGNSGVLLSRRDLKAFGAKINLKKDQLRLSNPDATLDPATPPAGHYEIDVLDRPPKTVEVESDRGVQSMVVLNNALCFRMFQRKSHKMGNHFMKDSFGCAVHGNALWIAVCLSLTGWDSRPLQVPSCDLCETFGGSRDGSVLDAPPQLWSPVLCDHESAGRTTDGPCGGNCSDTS